MLRLIVRSCVLRFVFVEHCEGEDHKRSVEGMLQPSGHHEYIYLHAMYTISLKSTFSYLADQKRVVCCGYENEDLAWSPTPALYSRDHCQSHSFNVGAFQVNETFSTNIFFLMYRCIASLLRLKILK